MGTRAKILFREDGEVIAQVYRSGDGYPSELGIDLQNFLREQRDTRPHDTRYNDVGVLAARWVHYELCNYAAKHRCECAIFTDPEDLDDIEYRYHVNYDSIQQQLTVQIDDLVKRKSEIFLTITHAH